MCSLDVACSVGGSYYFCVQKLLREKKKKNESLVEFIAKNELIKCRGNVGIKKEIIDDVC